jgi:hypothetical protein
MSIPTINSLPEIQDLAPGDKTVIERNGSLYLIDYDNFIIQTDQITFTKALTADKNQIESLTNFAAKRLNELKTSNILDTSARPTTFLIDSTTINTETSVASAADYVQSIKGSNTRFIGKNNLILCNKEVINQIRPLSASQTNLCDGQQVIIEKGVLNIPKGTYRINASITLSPNIEEDVSDIVEYTTIEEVAVPTERDIIKSIKETGLNPVYSYILPLYNVPLSSYELFDKDGIKGFDTQINAESLVKKQQQIWTYLSFDQLSPERVILNGDGATTFNVVGGSITLNLNGYFYASDTTQYGLKIHTYGELFTGIASNTYNHSSPGGEDDGSGFSVSDFFGRENFSQCRVFIERISNENTITPKENSLSTGSLQPLTITHVPLIYEAGWVNKLDVPDIPDIPFTSTAIPVLPFTYVESASDYSGSLKCYITEPGAYQGYLKVGDNVRYLDQLPDETGFINRRLSRYDIRDTSLNLLSPGWYGLVSDNRKQIGDFYNAVFRVDKNSVITRRWILSTTKQCPPSPISTVISEENTSTTPYNIAAAGTWRVANPELTLTVEAGLAVDTAFADFTFNDSIPLRGTRETTFIIPDRVKSINAVCLGGGGGSRILSFGSSPFTYDRDSYSTTGISQDWSHYGTGGNGGDLVWANNIPVKSGDVVRIVPGKQGEVTLAGIDSAAAGGDSELYINNELIMVAAGGGSSTTTRVLKEYGGDFEYKVNYGGKGSNPFYIDHRANTSSRLYGVENTVPSSIYSSRPYSVKFFGGTGGGAAGFMGNGGNGGEFLKGNSGQGSPGYGGAGGGGATLYNWNTVNTLSANFAMNAYYLYPSQGGGSALKSGYADIYNGGTAISPAWLVTQKQSGTLQNNNLPSLPYVYNPNKNNLPPYITRGQSQPSFATRWELNCADLNGDCGLPSYAPQYGAGASGGTTLASRTSENAIVWSDSVAYGGISKHSSAGPGYIRVLWGNNTKFPNEIATLPDFTTPPRIKLIT